MLVVDCLDAWRAEQSDPFLLLHAFGPMHISAMPQFGMCPHVQPVHTVAKQEQKTPGTRTAASTKCRT